MNIWKQHQPASEPKRVSKLDKLASVGDKVTCKREEAAYYSGYAGNPVVIFKPGMVGIVGSVKVPYVKTRNGQNRFFACVDFKVPGMFQGNPTFGNDTWRVGLDYSNIVKAK